MLILQDWVFNAQLPAILLYVHYNTCCLCSSLERKAPDMKRLSRPLRSSLRREVRRGRSVSREASVMLLPGRDKLSNLEPRHRPTWNKRQRRKLHEGRNVTLRIQTTGGGNHIVGNGYILVQLPQEIKNSNGRNTVIQYTHCQIRLYPYLWRQGLSFYSLVELTLFQKEIEYSHANTHRLLR